MSKISKTTLVDQLFRLSDELCLLSGYLKKRSLPVQYHVFAVCLHSIISYFSGFKHYSLKIYPSNVDIILDYLELVVFISTYVRTSLSSSDNNSLTIYSLSSQILHNLDKNSYEIDS